MGQFSGRPYRKAAGTAGAQLWRQRFSEEPGDSLENFAVLRSVTPVIQSNYTSLQSDYSSLDRAMAGGCTGAKRMQTATGMRRARSALASTFGSMPVRSVVTVMLIAGAWSPSLRPWRGAARDG